MLKDFLPRREAEYDEWEAKFIAKLIVHSAALGLDPLQVSALETLVTNHRNAFQDSIAKKAESKAADKLKNINRALADSAIREIARKCKTSSGYSNSIGIELGIIGPNHIPDLLNSKPEIINISYQPDKIVFNWLKRDFHGIVVYGALRNREHHQQTGAEQSNDFSVNMLWEEIGRDFRSPYEDSRSNLSKMPEIRYYKFRYLFKDRIVGVDTNIIQVTAEIYTKR